MDAYIYQADIHCVDCGVAIRIELNKTGQAPDNPQDETSYDSNEYPEGPYPNGGGEADNPQHCGSCHIFLENDLTKEGYAYVKEFLDEHGKSITNVERTWADFYGFTYKGWTSPKYNN